MVNNLIDTFRYEMFANIYSIQFNALNSIQSNAFQYIKLEDVKRRTSASMLVLRDCFKRNYLRKSPFGRNVHRHGITSYFVEWKYLGIVVHV